MCGIAGMMAPPAGRVTREAVTRMAARLRHRGPDDGGDWLDSGERVGLGHRRLSILDLSSAGRQPMVSPSGRYVLTFNGEVYNFEELRRFLESAGFRFRSQSDTEVVVAAFDHWGIEKATQQFVGMFAMGVWDTASRTMHLVRDRLGIKPLYYSWAGGWLGFASELKALLVAPACPRVISREALAFYVRDGYVPSPLSILSGILKVPPGHIVSITDGQRPVVKAFWRLLDVVRAGMEQPFRASDAEAIEQLHEVLRDAVKLRMVADVPLGAFLSGGVDSSAVVALMQSQSARPVNTFSIGFHEQDYNEAAYAKAIARQLGTNHRELYVTAREAQDVIPLLPMMYDEPFADVSQIPTYVVSRLARWHVMVSLS